MEPQSFSEMVEAFNEFAPYGLEHRKPLPVDPELHGEWTDEEPEDVYVHKATGETAPVDPSLMIGDTVAPNVGHEPAKPLANRAERRAAERGGSVTATFGMTMRRPKKGKRK